MSSSTYEHSFISNKNNIPIRCKWCGVIFGKNPIGKCISDDEKIIKSLLE